MALRLSYEFQVLTLVASGNDEILHFPAGNGQRRILPVLVLLEMVIIIGEEGNGGGYF